MTSREMKHGVMAATIGTFFMLMSNLIVIQCKVGNPIYHSQVNLVPRVPRLIGQQLVTRRDSGEFEKNLILNSLIGCP